MLVAKRWLNFGLPSAAHAAQTTGTQVFAVPGGHDEKNNGETTMLNRNTWGRGLAVAVGAASLALVAASCSPQPTQQQMADRSNQLYNLMEGAFSQLTPRQQRLVCRDFNGSLPDSLQIDAAAARSDIVATAVIGRGVDPLSAEQATDQVLAEEC